MVYDARFCIKVRIQIACDVRACSTMEILGYPHPTHQQPIDLAQLCSINRRQVYFERLHHDLRSRGWKLLLIAPGVQALDKLPWQNHVNPPLVWPYMLPASLVCCVIHALEITASRHVCKMC